MKSSKNTRAKAASGEQGKKVRSPATMAARRQASARYREKNLDEERDKARERMARHRERVMDQAELAEDFRARAREASRRYREKNGKALAHRQRVIRMSTYETRHGRHAWLKHQNELEQRRAEAEEAEELADFRRRAAEVERIVS
ncbi:hypothetical protein B0H14DRAFT_3479429 [Mycena olivaceomarginata]|nr:hypothetical protein B0H14DRAFT_3479429 [Mycena olivaceomarginata]